MRAGSNRQRGQYWARRALVLGAALASLALAVPGEGEARQKNLTYKDFPGQAGPEAPGAYVARTQAEWTNLWQLANLPPPRTLIEGKEIGVGVFSGTRPTGGYSVTVRNVIEDRDEVTVEVDERRPWPGAVVTQAFTSPYVIVVFESEAETVVISNRIEPDVPPKAAGN